MKEVHRIHHLESARVLLNPIRVAMLELLREPGTSAELSEKLEMSQQRINNHLKELLSAGFIKRVENRTKRNLIEGVYQAVSKHYWLSPKLTREKGRELENLKEQMSLHNLLIMSERLQEDAATLLERTHAEEVPSIGVTAEITLRNSEEREQFTREFLQAIHSVLEKYQAPSGPEQKFTAMIVCYPKKERKSS